MWNRLLTAVGIYVLIPFLYLSRYVHPSADDFMHALDWPRYGFGEIVKKIYLEWSGRYFSQIIYKYNPAVYHSLPGYRLVSVAWILMSAGVMVLLVRTITKQYLSRSQSWALAALLIALNFAKMPSTPEAFYWFSSASTYQLENILDMLVLVFVFKLSTGHRRRPLNFIVSALLCILIIGGNEVSLIITVGFVLLLSYSQYTRDRSGAVQDLKGPRYPAGPRYLLALSAICIFFTIIEVTAPGNYTRIRDAQPFSGSIGWTIAGSISITAVYLSQWLGPILAASVLYIPLFGMPIARKMREEGRSPGISLKNFLWYYIGAFSLIQVFIVWVSGGSSLGRIFDVIYLFFLLGYFFILQLVVVKYEHRLDPLQRYSAAFSWLGGVLFLSSLLDINNNISTAYVDLVSGKARQYDVELTERQRLVRECKSDTCVVPDLSDIPSTIFFTDIRPLSDEYSKWINVYYRGYYGGAFPVPQHGSPVPRSNFESLRNIGRAVRGRLIERK